MRKRITVLDPQAGPFGFSTERVKFHAHISGEILGAFFRCVQAFYSDWPCSSNGWTRTFPTIMAENFPRYHHTLQNSAIHPEPTNPIFFIHYVWRSFHWSMFPGAARTLVYVLCSWPGTTTVANLSCRPPRFHTTSKIMFPSFILSSCPDLTDLFWNDSQENIRLYRLSSLHEAMKLEDNRSSVPAMALQSIRASVNQL